MNNSMNIGVVVLYRWKLKPEFELQFIESWAQATQCLLGYGSYGSRLHKGSDEIWYAYAQWPNLSARDDAFERSKDVLRTDKMVEAISETFPPVFLEPVSDFLVMPRL